MHNKNKKPITPFDLVKFWVNYPWKNPEGKTRKRELLLILEHTNKSKNLQK
jgi:hypothetical protein